jgi:hypothetical protein
MTGTGNGKCGANWLELSRKKRLDESFDKLIP